MRDDNGADKRESGAPSRGRKRPYVRPAVREYGSIAKLTQSGGSTKPEPGGGKKAGLPCL